MKFAKHTSIKDLADYQHTIRHLRIHDAHLADMQTQKQKRLSMNVDRLMDI